MKILVVKLSSLGDLFHALPAVRALKHGLKADVDWVTHTAYADLVKCFSDVRHTIGFSRREWARQWRPFLRELRRERYDLIVDLQGLTKSALVGWFARGTRRIGPSHHRELSRFFYHEVVGHWDKNRHAVEEVCRCRRRRNSRSFSPRKIFRPRIRSSHSPRARAGPRKTGPPLVSAPSRAPSTKKQAPRFSSSAHRKTNRSAMKLPLPWATPP